MSDTIKVMRCPSCGGPIQFEEKASLAICSFCGMQVKRKIESEPEVEQRVSVDLSAYYSPETNKRRNTIVGIIVVVSILVILGITFLSVTMVDQAVNGSSTLQPGVSISTNQILSIPEAYLVDPAGPKFLLAVYLRDSTYRYIYLDFGAETLERWRTEPLPEEYYRAVIMNDEQSIYVVLKTEMYALSQADGSELWRVTLSDELSVACDMCVIKAGSQVVTLTNDGQLSSYDALKGTKLWGTLLEETTRALVLLDGKPAVWDKGEDGAVVRVFDLATGKEAQRIAPSGPNEPFPNDPQTPNVYSPLLVDPDGKSFYTMFGTFEPLSIQRWDAQTGQMIWHVEAPDGFSRSSLDTAPLLSGGYLFLADEGNILAIESASGTLRSLETQDQYELTPLAVQEGKLLVSAKRSRGTSRDELWAFDLQSGAPAWKVVPEAQNRMDDQFGFVDSDGDWIFRLVNGGVVLIQFQNEPMGMTYQRIDLTSGVGGAQKTMMPPDQDVGSTMFIRALIWQGENLWYAGDKLYLIDFNNATSIVKWP